MTGAQNVTALKFPQNGELSAQILHSEKGTKNLGKI